MARGERRERRAPTGHELIRAAVWNRWLIFSTLGVLGVGTFLFVLLPFMSGVVPFVNGWAVFLLWLLIIAIRNTLIVVVRHRLFDTPSGALLTGFCAFIPLAGLLISVETVHAAGRALRRKVPTMSWFGIGRSEVDRLLEACCDNCGYDLRSLEENDRVSCCPECGYLL